MNATAIVPRTTFDYNEPETYAETRERLAHELSYEKQVALAEARQRRLERMAELTAQFLGKDCADIIFA